MARSAVFAKLNLKDQTELVVLNAPESFEHELSTLRAVSIRRGSSWLRGASFVLAFVTKQTEVDSLAKALTKTTAADAVVWFAYPKGSSKRYRCEFNRDTGWQALGAAGFEPVRMVAIDADWSAARFRRAEHIKRMTRDPARALSKVGKARAVKERKAPR